MARLIVFLVIIGFSVVKALINAAQEKAKAEQARQQRQAQVGGPNRQRTVQSEIDAFLQEADSPAQRPAQKTDSQQARERRERRRRQAEMKKRDSEKRRSRESRSERSQPGSRDIGSGVAKHVDQYINKHVNDYLDSDVEEYVEATIVDSVEENLGKHSVGAAPTTTAQRNMAAESVVALLKDPKGVRNAILVNEILARPRVLDR